MALLCCQLIRSQDQSASAKVKLNDVIGRWNLGVTLIGATAEYTDPIGLTALILDIKSVNVK